MRDVYEDEEPAGRPVLWTIFAALLVVTVVAVGLTWRSGGFDKLLAMAGVDRHAGELVPVIHAADVGAPSVDVGERIGDWFVACNAAATDCSLTQTVRQADGPAASWRIEPTASAGLVGVWTMPTGILVGRGMQLALDDGKPSVIPYESCAPSSCEVRAKLGVDFIELMRAAGKTGTTVTLKGGATRTYSFSHNGLAAGLARLAATASR